MWRLAQQSESFSSCLCAEKAAADPLFTYVLFDDSRNCFLIEQYDVYIFLNVRSLNIVILHQPFKFESRTAVSATGRGFNPHRRQHKFSNGESQ
jgi:hypothetical protein